MPKAEGHPVKLIRLDRNTLLTDIHFEGRRIRKSFSTRSYVAFLDGDATPDSNLPPTTVPIAFADFVRDRYLPGEARPRLPNDTSFGAEEDLAIALVAKLEDRPLHQITNQTAEEARASWLREGRFNNTIKRRLNCLRRILGYAKRNGLIKDILVLPIKGLPSGDRNKIWLRLLQIDHLLQQCALIHPILPLLVLFLILTRARIGEALDFRKGDLRGDRLWLPTEKKRVPMRQAMRALDVAKLGPRFPGLMRQLKPNAAGFYFYAESDRPLSYSYACHLFDLARTAAEIPRARIHDLRRTGNMHAAINGSTFWELKSFLGQEDAASIQWYLDQGQLFDPAESIFHDPSKNATTNGSAGQNGLQTGHILSDNSVSGAGKTS